MRKSLDEQPSLEFIQSNGDELFYSVKKINLNGVPMVIFSVNFHKNEILKAQFYSGEIVDVNGVAEALERLRDNFMLMGKKPSRDIIKKLTSAKDFDEIQAESVVTFSGRPCDIDVYVRKMKNASSRFADVTYYVMEVLDKKRKDAADEAKKPAAKEPSADQSPSEATTLFSIGGTSGKFFILAKNGRPLEKPEEDTDQTPDPQIIQMINRPSGNPDFLLVTNGGNVDVKLSRVANALVFSSVSDGFHSTLTVCLDRKFSDGTFLVIETMVRPEMMGAGITTARVFTGRARPSPILKTIFKLD